jgi:LPS sulfotransferase NodH
MAKKFIIITTARSGSQMLCEFLDNQLNIRCEFEILQSQKEMKYRKFLVKGGASYGCLESHNKCLEILGDDPSKFVGNRNRKFIEYLKIWEDVVPCDFFGFKVFFENHLGTHKLSQEDAISYEDFAKYIKDNDIKIIHLTRDNIFLKYISAITSQITGVHSSANSISINSISVEILYDSFIKFKDNFLEEKQNVFDFCLENEIDVHHVTYENLTGPQYVDYYKGILSFIGADPNLFIDIRGTSMQNRIKTNIFPLRHKVSNLDQLIEEATKAGDIELLDIINIELSKD